MENKEEKKVETTKTMSEWKKRLLAWKVRRALKKHDKPQKVKTIEMRKRETDVRHLKTGDYRQLMYRESRDTNAYLKFMNMGINDIAMTLLVIAEHMGIDVTNEVEKKRLALMEQMQKEQKKPESN